MLAYAALITGVGLGSMYGLLALGFHVTYAVSNTVNFAQGSTMMLGAVLCFAFWVTLGWPLALAIPASLLLCAVWSIAVERIAVRPFVRTNSNSWLMATVALGIVLENIVLFTFGKDPRGFPMGTLTTTYVPVGGIKVQALQLLIPVLGLALAAGIHQFFQRTRYGKALLAVVQNRDAARLMGIDIDRVVTASFALSGFLAGVAGILVAPLFTISSTMGTLFGIKAFAVAILGGIGSAWGVVLAGLIYGIVEALITSTLGSTYTQIVTFTLVIAALVVRPSGLFGRAEVKKGMSARTIVAAVLALALLGFAIAKADGYQIFIIAMVGLTAIVGIGLNVLLGLTGQISFGHVAFYAIGAYTLGILTTKAGLSFWLALPAAMIVSGIAGLALAVPALRIRGPYLAMVTIAFGFVVEQGAVEWSGLTGGWNGLMGIAVPSLFGYTFSERDTVVLIVALTILSLWLYARLAASPWGLGMRALRDSEVASQSIGLDPVLIRAAAFVVSAVAAGMAGGIFASISSFISPESFPFFQSILFVLVVMAGGAERVLGPVVGAIIVVLLPELLSSLAQYRLLFVGLLLLLMLRLAPGGFVGLAARFFEKKANGKVAIASRDVAEYLGQSTQRSGLLVSDLSISFGGVRAVRDVGFEARPGEITSIIGPNGAGKSTVLNLICGFYRADSGVVRLGIQDLMGRSSSAIAQAGLARTYQTTQLFGEMSVIDNIIVALRRGHLGATTLFSPERNSENEAVAESLLAFVGYRGPIETLASALPHVDKRLIEIARALAIRPSVLLLDEPAAGLDDADTERLGKLLTAVARIGIIVILVEHDMQLVMGVSDRVVVLDAGAKIADGAPTVVAADPAVLKAYLGAERSVDRSRKVALRPGETVLSVARLSAGYGAVDVLHDVDVSVEQGGFVAVLGANGAGKSTLMRALSGLSRPVSGEIKLGADAIETLPANKIASRGLILVPEGRQVFPELSVIDNLRLGAYARGSGDVEKQVQGFLDRFPNLEARRNQRAGLLSGGEQQMLAIARGLMANPRVLMLDEPSLGLAPKLVEEMYDLLAGLRDEGVTILLVDQTAVMALSVADRAYVLQSGAIVHSGSARELSADPALAQAYLGGHN